MSHASTTSQNKTTFYFLNWKKNEEKKNKDFHTKAGGNCSLQVKEIKECG